MVLFVSPLPPRWECFDLGSLGRKLAFRRRGPPRRRRGAAFFMYFASVERAAPGCPFGRERRFLAKETDRAQRCGCKAKRANFCA